MLAFLLMIIRRGFVREMGAQDRGRWAAIPVA